MKFREPNFTEGCPTIEIASYVDGELDLTRELELEMHFAECSTCAEELSLQKQFLCALDSSMIAETEIELPADFAKKVVANAESSVSGLRKPIERFNAVFICAALMLFVLFAIGADAGSMLVRLTDIVDKAGAVVGFLGHIVFSFLLGVGVVLKSVTGQVQMPAAAAFFFLAIAALIIVRFSRGLIRFRRT